MLRKLELAVAGAEESLEQIDDTNGEAMPAIQLLAEVHRRARQQRRPDPVEPTERLFHLQTEGSWDTFYDVLPDYREPLGNAGLRRYQELVEGLKLPALSEKKLSGTWDGRRMRLEHAMEGR